MLKLPKGLKKKKKGKKSKKDQELFTEEELEQYRREHQNQSALNSAVPSDSEEQQQQQPQSQLHQSHHQPAPSAAGASGEKSGETDEEWSKFAALTSGIDSVLKKTQGDLDRIKSTSFFQKVPTKVEQEDREREEREWCAQEERRKAEEQAAKVEEEKRSAEELIGAVVELSDSDHNSETEEDIFDTGYIDAIARGELPIAYVPESPTLESFDGPDPFDTSYAEKVIKGPEVSKRGKKLVSIGSAVEVLTGRVEGAGTCATKNRRQRRGPQNLLLASFDEGDQQQQQSGDQGDDNITSDRKDSPALTLLDDPADLPTSNIEIDLSVSLHLNLQKQQQQQQQGEHSPIPEQPDLGEFDELTTREPVVVAGIDNLELLLGKSTDREASPETSALNLDAFDAPESDDPFYTGFVERLLPATAVEDDEFDPRADTEEDAGKQQDVATPDFFSADGEEHADSLRSFVTPVAPLQDLLSVSTSDLTGLGDKPLEVPGAEIPRGTTEQADPFDTTAIDLIVAPGKAELKFLEEELLSDPRGQITHSLSDPDFDPRADDATDTALAAATEAPGPEDARLEQDLQSLVQRKSSLSLHISAGTGGAPCTNRSKSVVFAVVTPDLLKLDGADQSSATKKPLTPYYSRESSLPDLEADPFDTSFVPPVAPTSLELSLLEQELTSADSHDFNPRADESEQAVRLAADLLGAGHDQQQADAQKVLTPARPSASTVQQQDLDPFDTTIAHNLQPGQAELKLLESELIPAGTSTPTVVIDILSDAAHEPSSVFVKVLTPQVSGHGSLDRPFGDGDGDDDQEQSQRCEVDPFDTSIAENIGPGRTEIKLLEDELIDH